MVNKKISELVKVTSSNATDEYVLRSGATNVSIQAQYLSALSSSYAVTASFAVSSSVEIKQEITSSYAETASYAYSTTVLSGSASDARNELVTKISGSSVAPIAALSASLTVTNQAISSSVATLSGSASDARNLIVADNSALSASLTVTDQAISSSVATLSGSASDARDLLVTKISGSSTAAILALSASLTSTDQAISSSIAALSGSASDARNNIESASYASTASYAISSSHEVTHEISSSYAETASYASTASYAISSSHEIIHETSSSYAETASYALNGGGTNPTNNFVPLRSDATTFIDSPISVITESISYQPSSTVTTGTLSLSAPTFDFSNLGNVPWLETQANFSGFTIGERIRITDTVGTADAIIGGFNDPTEVGRIDLLPIPGVDYSGAPTLSNANGILTFTELEEVTTSGLTHITGSIFGESISGSFSGSFTGSYLGNLEGTASYALNAGGTNPTNSIIPVNSSGSFIDSPINVVAGTGNPSFPTSFSGGTFKLRINGTYNGNAGGGQLYLASGNPSFVNWDDIELGGGTPSIRISRYNSLGTGTLQSPPDGFTTTNTNADLYLIIYQYATNYAIYHVNSVIQNSDTSQTVDITFDQLVESEGTVLDGGGVPPILGGVNEAFGIQFATDQSTLRESSISTTSILVSSGFTGSLLGTSSYATTASYALNGGDGGSGFPSEYVTSDITAEKNKTYIFETSTPYTLTLPLSPTNGDSIQISNRSNIGTNELGGNGELIMGDVDNLTLDLATASFTLTYAGGTQGWVIIGAGGGATSGSAAPLTTGSIEYHMLDDSFKTRASNVTLSSGTTSAVIDFDSSAVFEITTPTDTTATTLNFDNAEIGMNKVVLIVNQGTAGSGTITLGQTVGTGTFIRTSSDDIVRTASTTNYLQITCIGESGDDRTFVYTVGTAQ